MTYCGTWYLENDIRDVEYGEDYVETITFRIYVEICSNISLSSSK